MSEQPQEWTPEWFETTFQDHDWIQQVCDAHNAALAELKSATESFTPYFENNELKKQLAVERETVKQCGECLGARDKLIAAERKAVEYETQRAIANESTIREHFATIKSLRRQLLGRAQSLKMLVDALESYEYDGNGCVVTWLSQKAWADVLAKAKEGK